MDTATLLQRVDTGQYLTCTPFLQDVDLIVRNAKVHSYLQPISFTWLLNLDNSKSVVTALEKL